MTDRMLPKPGLLNACTCLPMLLLASAALTTYVKNGVWPEPTSVHFDKQDVRDRFRDAACKMIQFKYNA